MDHGSDVIVHLRTVLREMVLLFIPAVLLIGWAIGVFAAHFAIPGRYALLSSVFGVLAGNALLVIYGFRQLLHRRTLRLALDGLKDR